jgi:hypothetical protein
MAKRIPPRPHIAFLTHDGKTIMADRVFLDGREAHNWLMSELKKIRRSNYRPGQFRSID